MTYYFQTGCLLIAAIYLFDRMLIKARRAQFMALMSAAQEVKHNLDPYDLPLPQALAAGVIKYLSFWC